MHKTIIVLVASDNQGPEEREDVISSAESLLIGICEEGGFYDYYGVMKVSEEPGALEMAWPVLEPDGERWLTETLKAQREGFMQAMREVREGLKHLSDEELWFGVDKSGPEYDHLPPLEVEHRFSPGAGETYSSRLHLKPDYLLGRMAEAGGDDGGCFIYGVDFGRLETSKEVQGFLSTAVDTGEGRIWVVVADVHY